MITDQIRSTVYLTDPTKMIKARLRFQQSGHD